MTKSSNTVVRRDDDDDEDDPSLMTDMTGSHDCKGTTSQSTTEELDLDNVLKHYKKTS